MECDPNRRIPSFFHNVAAVSSDRCLPIFRRVLRERDIMRMHRFLLGSAATLAAGGFAGTVQAQDVVPSVATMQGQSPMRPVAQPPTSANDNNNAQTAMRPGTVANPAPGTIVIHLNARVNVGFESIWSSADQRVATAPAGSPGGPTIAPGAPTPLATVLGNNGSGSVKLAPGLPD